MTTTRQRIVVIGGRADGHGKVVCEAAAACRHIEVAGFLDDAPTEKSLAGAPWLGPTKTWTDLVARGDLTFHIAIGHNLTRRKLAAQLLAGGARLGSVIHPGARIAASAHVGGGTLVADGAILAPGARIGANCIVNHGAIVEHDAVVADSVNLSSGFACGGRAQIEEGVFAGIGVVLIPDVRVASWSYIGAGGVVVENTEPGGLYVGVPVQRVRTLGSNDWPVAP